MNPPSSTIPRSMLVPRSDSALPLSQPASTISEPFGNVHVSACASNLGRSRSGHSASSLRMCGTTIRLAILPVGAAYRTDALGLDSAHSSASRQHSSDLPQRREQHSTNTRPCAA